MFILNAINQYVNNIVYVKCYSVVCKQHCVNQILLFTHRFYCFQIVDMLLEKPDIDVNAATSYDGQTALILAAAVDHQPIVEALLAHPDIKADAKTTLGYNAALYALMIGNTEIYNILNAHSKGGQYFIIL